MASQEVAATPGRGWPLLPNPQRVKGEVDLDNENAPDYGLPVGHSYHCWHEDPRDGDWVECCGCPLSRRKSLGH